MMSKKIRFSSALPVNAVILQIFVVVCEKRAAEIFPKRIQRNHSKISFPLKHSQCKVISCIKVIKALYKLSDTFTIAKNTPCLSTLVP